MLYWWLRECVCVFARSENGNTRDDLLRVGRYNNKKGPRIIFCMGTSTGTSMRLYNSNVQFFCSGTGSDLVCVNANTKCNTERRERKIERGRGRGRENIKKNRRSSSFWLILVLQPFFSSFSSILLLLVTFYFYSKFWKDFYSSLLKLRFLLHMHLQCVLKTLEDEYALHVSRVTVFGCVFLCIHCENERQDLRYPHNFQMTMKKFSYFFGVHTRLFILVYYLYFCNILFVAMVKNELNERMKNQITMTQQRNQQREKSHWHWDWQV